MNHIREVLSGVIRENPGLFSTGDVKYLARGSRNCVYSAEDKVIKLGYGKKEAHMHAVEEWFYNNCSGQNISPHVYKRGMISGTPYMILDYAGEPITTGTEELGKKFGNLFRKLHEIDISDIQGFGWLQYTDNGIKGNKHGEEELKAMYLEILKAGAADVKTRNLLDCSHELNEVVHAIENRDVLKINPSLTFHDWNPKNFLKNNGNVVLIDPQPNIEDPLVDYALLELSCDMNDSAVFNAPFLDGFNDTYFKGRIKTPEESAKIFAYKLFTALALFYECEISDKKEISGKNNKYSPLIKNYVLNSALIN